MDDLLAKIREGVYRPGDKMPTEPEVMAQQGVSRTVVREAMSRLQASGYVETRHGIGTFVLPPPVLGLPALDPAASTSILELLDILELRIGLESEAAGLAALRRSEEHLGLMQRALEDFEQEARANRSAADPDYRFHLQIALATGNPYYENLHRRLGMGIIPRTRLDTSRMSSQPTSEYLKRTNREHRAILEAIIKRDAYAAREAMRKHLSDSRERLRQAYMAQGKL